MAGFGNRPSTPGGASAAKFSPVKPPIPAAPTGGGALRPVGETFHASPATGALSVAVALDLFAEAETGRQVFAPSLSLVLESGAGNGCFGGGWQVPISAVTRMVDKRLPEYNHHDAFMVKGLGELVPALRADGTPDTRRAGEHDIARYRLRFEGAFDRIELWSHRRTGEAHWIITTRDNVTHTYGATPEARIANPRDSRLVFSWLLERSEDDRGHVILYRYKAEDLDDVDSSAAEWNRLRGAQPITNRYPKYIRFGNTVPFDREGTSCLFHVAFDYGEHDLEIPTPDEAPGRSWPARQDPIRWCRAGFEIRTFRLCRRILMFHDMAELGPGPTLLRSVDLSYDENPYLTKLASITKKGYQRAVGSSGPYSVKVASWERFQYTSDEIRTEVKTLGHNPRQLAPVLSYKHAQWIDLDGDALPGVLSNSGVALYYAKNHGRGRIDPPRALPTKPSVISGRPGPLNLMDLDADGTKQFVMFERPLAGYFTRDAKNDTWEPMVYFDSIPTIDWRNPDILFLDLNGDNRVDILVPSARGYDWYPSLGRSGFGAARSFPRPSDEQEGPVIAHASQRQLILLADMTGDGLTDIVRVENGRVCYWPNMGYGRFGAMVTMDNPPRFDRDHAFDAQRIRVGDIDGSGTADLLYFGSEGLVLWRNQAGNRFGEAVKLGVYPDPLTRVDVLDVLGTGTASIVWSNASPGREHTVFTMDLMGSKKPHLLERVTNHLGGEARFAFTPSTNFYVDDLLDGNPWVTRLHFVVQLLGRVESYDPISRLLHVAEYRYHDGYFDPDERALYGFGFVEQVDTQSFSRPNAPGLFAEATPRNIELPQPPVLTKTWYPTGSYRHDRALKQKREKARYSLDAEAKVLPDSALPAGLAAEELKDALRALRGSMIRQETYALDKSRAERHPYIVLQNRFEVRRLQPPKGEARGSFLVVPRESLTLQYERYEDSMGRVDPRTIHTLAVVVDEHGAVRRSVEVTYPRRHAPLDEDHAPQRALYATLTETEVVHLATLEDGYRLHIPSETCAYELHGLTVSGGILTFEDVERAVNDASVLSYEQTPTVGPQKRRIEHVRMRYYDSASLPNPLPFGAADVRALPYETYLLAFTPGLLATTLNAAPSASDATPSERPEERVTPEMLREGGYVQLDDSSAWWIPSGRQVLDPTRFYVPTSVVDPFGRFTAIEYDRHALLITRTRDAVDNERRVENDYRTLAPCLITEPNGNRIATRFDEIGVAVASAVMGKEGDTGGDTLDDPTTVVEADLLRFETTGKPGYIRMRKRERHGDPSTRWQESISYFNGTGREIMRKARAEPGPAPVVDDHGHLVHEVDGSPVLALVSPRWVATGRTVLNNKGDVIKQYEPFFSGTHEFEDEDELVEWGVTRVFHHDPMHRLIRTDYPDGTRSRRELTPWLTETWDPSDTVTEPGNAWAAARKPEAVPAPSAAEQRAAELSALHSGTPAVEELDPLGRPFLSFSDLGRGQRLKETVELDIEGHPLRKIDARSNVAEENRFDIAGRRLYQKSNDAGERWMLPDVLGNPFYSWDERRIQRRALYDALRRPIELWFQEDGAPEVLAERTVYGETQPDAAANNLRTKVYQQLDGAGLVENPAYDFKGNLVRSLRRLTEDFKTQPDWSRDPALEAEIFVTATECDALSRPVLITLSDQSVIRPTYNEAGLLDAVAARIRGEAAWTVFVENIDYNARGQRERIRYGNGVVTDYTYSPLTSRLVRLKTIRLGDGVVLQDLRFVHDAVGNIVQIDDKAQKTLFHDGQEVEPVTKLVYDAIGRLIAAYGREHAGQNANVQQDQNGFPLQSVPNPNDPQAMRNYAELYEVDGTGNLLAMVHQAGSGRFTRRYEVAAESNRLLSQHAGRPGQRFLLGQVHA